MRNTPPPERAAGCSRFAVRGVGRSVLRTVVSVLIGDLTIRVSVARGELDVDAGRCRVVGTDADDVSAYRPTMEPRICIFDPAFETPVWRFVVRLGPVRRSVGRAVLSEDHVHLVKRHLCQIVVAQLNRNGDTAVVQRVKDGSLQVFHGETGIGTEDNRPGLEAHGLEVVGMDVGRTLI